MCPVEITWEQTRAFRLARLHVSEQLGPRSLRKVARDIGGVHAQVASAGELVFAVRAPGLAPRAISRALWERRTLVKTWAMRGTLHYIEADDFPIWAAAARTRNAWRRPSWERAFKIKVAEVEATLEAIPDVLDGRRLTRVELADGLYEHLRSDAVDRRVRSGWGELLKIAASHGLICFGPNEGRNVTFVRPDQWLQSWEQFETDEAIAEVCRRYLASHGPATREEFARWWGFFPPDARRTLESLGDEIVQVDRAGDKAFARTRDLDEMRRGSEDQEVRLLGMFDPYTLAGLPHDAIVPKAMKDKVYRPGAWVSQVVLVGGRVAGTWTHASSKRGSTIAEVAPFEVLTRSQKRAVRERLATLQPYIGEMGSVSFV
jgi:hypothetical protein